MRGLKGDLPVSPRGLTVTSPPRPSTGRKRPRRDRDALACDISISAETAIFGLEPKVGLSPGGGIHGRPPDPHHTPQIGVTAFDRAHEAKQIGMVNEVVPPGRLTPTAERR